MIPSPCSFFSSGHLESTLSVIFSTSFPFSNQGKEGGVAEWVTHHLATFKRTSSVNWIPSLYYKNKLQMCVIKSVFTKTLCVKHMQVFCLFCLLSWVLLKHSQPKMMHFSTRTRASIGFTFWLSFFCKCGIKAKQGAWMAGSRIYFSIKLCY